MRVTGLCRQFFRPLTMFVIMGSFCISYSYAQTEAQAGGDAEAQQSYKAKCQMCHAADGSGNTPAGKKLGAKDLKSQEVQSHSDAELFTIIAKGQKKMPAFKGKLSDQQMLALVAEIRRMARATAK